MPKSEEMISVLVNLHCQQQTVEEGGKSQIKTFVYSLSYIFKWMWYNNEPHIPYCGDLK